MAQSCTLAHPNLYAPVSLAHSGVRRAARDHQVVRKTARASRCSTLPGTSRRSPVKGGKWRGLDARRAGGDGLTCSTWPRQRSSPVSGERHRHHAGLAVGVFALAFGPFCARVHPADARHARVHRRTGRTRHAARAPDGVQCVFREGFTLGEVLSRFLVTVADVCFTFNVGRRSGDWVIGFAVSRLLERKDFALPAP